MFQSLRTLRFVSLAILTFAGLAWSQKTASRPAAPPTPTPNFTDVEPGTGGYQPYDNTPLKFSSKAEYVLVPAVVTGKDGKPVTGLKMEDFHLQENGKDQKIASVEEVIPSLTPLIPTPAASANEATNQPAIQDHTVRRLIIIALDMVNTPYFDQARARRQVISYLSDSLDPDSLYQIVAVEPNGLRILHDFTEDPAELIATLKEIRSHFSARDRLDNASLANFGVKENGDKVTPGATSVGPSGNSYTLDFNYAKVDYAEWAAAKDAEGEGPIAVATVSAAVDSTLRAFHQIAERLSGIPGRKSLIWITGGFPFSIDPGTAAVSDGVIFGVYQHVMQELGNQMIAVYPVDARGLLTDESFDASVHLVRSQNRFPESMFDDSSNRQRDVFDTMRAFADMTGGRAYLNTNDTTGAVHAAAQDGSRYYLLSYPIDKTNHRPGWRKITVKVADFHVRAREGYFLTHATVDSVASVKYDIDAALLSPLDYTGLPLKVRLEPAVTAGSKRKVTFSMLMPPNVITIDSADKNHMFVDVAYVVLTSTGKSASKKGTSYNLNLNPVQLQQIETKGVGLDDTVEVSPGSYKLRVVVRDNLNGRIGSVLANLRVN